MAKLKDTQIDGNLYVSEDIQIGDISVTDKIDELNDAYYNNPSYSNPNLLINGDFRVNQRGQSSYVGNLLYTVDRWRMNGNNTVTVQADGGLALTSSGTWRGVHQYIEFPSLLSGKTVTISAKCYSQDGKCALSIRKGGENSTTSLGGVTSESSSKPQIIKTTITLPQITDADKIIVALWTSSANASSIWYWVKLEIGEVATPFVPRLYAEELALCQRYFINYKPLDHTGLMGSGGDRIYIPMQIFTNMRTIPTVVHNITSITMYYNGSYNSGIAVSGVTANADYELVFSTTAVSSIKSCAVAFFWARGSILQFDAEIY